MITHAVLTGDIIGSSKLGPGRLDEAMKRLRRLAVELEEAHPDSVVGGPDVFRGDSWQLCLKQPALAVTAAVFMRAGLKAGGFDSRIGIGLGSVEQLNEEHISESVGPAFKESGEALDLLGKDQTLALSHRAEAPAQAALDVLKAGVGLLDALLSGWTLSESAAVYGTLRGLSQEAIAELPDARTKEGKAPTRQAIHDALRRVSWGSHVQPFLKRSASALDEVL